MLTLTKLNELRALSVQASEEMKAGGDAPSLKKYEDELFNVADDLFDAAALAVTPLNQVANKYLEALDKNKVLHLKITELENKIQQINEDAAGEDI